MKRFVLILSALLLMLGGSVAVAQEEWFLTKQMWNDLSQRVQDSENEIRELESRLDALSLLLTPTATPRPTRRPTATPRPTRRPTATPRPTRRPTATPRPAPSSESVKGTLSNPVRKRFFYPLGEWHIGVYEFNPDATEIVLRENIFNSAPPPGHNYVIVTMAAKYMGKGVGNISWAFTYRLKGRGNLLYDDGTCGVIPDNEIFAPDVLPGGIVSYNLCWTVPDSDIQHPLLYVEPLFFGDGVWFDVVE